MPYAAAAAERRIVHGARPILWPAGGGWIRVPLGWGAWTDRPTDRTRWTGFGLASRNPGHGNVRNVTIWFGLGGPDGCAVRKKRSGTAAGLVARDEYLYLPPKFTARRIHTQQQSAEE